MEDFLEEAGKGLLRLVGLLVRSAVWLIWEMAIVAPAWYAGWSVCKVCTLGYYPRLGIHQHDQAPTMSGAVVCLVGLISMIALGTLLAMIAGEF